METLIEMGSIVKGNFPYTDDERRLLKDIFTILDFKDDTEENVEELRQLLTHLNLSFVNRDIRILNFYEENGEIEFSYINVFDKFMNKLNFLYAILDHEIDIYNRLEENDVENRRHFAHFVYNLYYNNSDYLLLQYLFESGISPDISIVIIDGSLSFTLLHTAVEASIEDTEFLLSYGADPNNHNIDTTPTERAFELNEQYPNNPIYIQTLKLLLAYGGDYTGHENNPIVQKFLAENAELQRVSNLYVGDNLDEIVSSYHRKNERMQFGKKEDGCVIN